ncbi:MAG: hypothetical protein ABSE51_20250 [Terracidiphilus sp.]|jgi:hypothetical protein
MGKDSYTALFSAINAFADAAKEELSGGDSDTGLTDNSLAIIKLLLSNGIKIEVGRFDSGATALIEASYDLEIPILRLLLAHGAK